MLGPLRRSRWLALLLFALAPGVGGQLVAAMHPCPADSPGVVATAPSHSGAGHHESSSTPSPSHTHQDGGGCTCVGLCCAPVLVSIPPRSLPLGAAVVGKIARLPWPLIEAADRLTPLQERLPPKTAPPTA